MNQCFLCKKKEGESRGPSRAPLTKQIVADATSSTLSGEGKASTSSLSGSEPEQDVEEFRPLSILFSESEEEGDIISSSSPSLTQEVVPS